MKRFLLSLSALLWAWGAVTMAATQITGAGATFPYPIYSKWFSEFHKENPDVEINYQSIGSGGGIRQFTEKTVDFGATDAPMTDEQLKKAAVTVLHIPTVLGAVVVTYNLAGVSGGLKMTPDVLADIYLGKITKWTDPRITKLNPGVTLSGDVLVVHRSDGSGTSNIFTDYLSKVSPDWKSKVGAGTAVNWPVGLGGKGNEGVSGLVKQTPGTIGYVELIYAENNKLPYASLKNAAGEYVAPSLKSVTAAAAAALANMPADYRVSITDPKGKDAYPIAGFTYLLVWKQMPDAAKGKIMVGFLNWAMTKGQTFAEGLYYSPLPPSLVNKVKATIKEIELKKMN